MAPIDLSDVRSRQSAGVLWSARGWGRVAVWGVGRVGSQGQRKELWLGACTVKDQLQPEGSPRRIYNARVRVMEWFRFNSHFSPARKLLLAPSSLGKPSFTLLLVNADWLIMVSVGVLLFF